MGLQWIWRQQQRKVSPWLAAILIFCLTWLSLSAPVAANDKLVTRQLEAEVLEIIRSHPEAIWNSLQTYLAQEKQQKQQAQQAILQQLKTLPAKVIGSSPTAGSPQQKIVLLEFSDFQCPYCGLAQDTVKEFMTEHEDEVTLVYKHYPLSSIHPQAMAAATAAIAAHRQGKFWQYHDALFEQQDRLGEEFYQAIARDLNLDLEQFNRDRQSDAALFAIEQDIQLAQTLGIQGTPFFIMNEETFSGAIPLSQIEEIFQRQKSR